MVKIIHWMVSSFPRSFTTWFVTVLTTVTNCLSISPRKLYLWFQVMSGTTQMPHSDPKSHYSTYPEFQHQVQATPTLILPPAAYQTPYPQPCTQQCLLVAFLEWRIATCHFAWKEVEDTDLTVGEGEDDRVRVVRGGCACWYRFWPLGIEVGWEAGTQDQAPRGLAPK